MRPRSTMMLPAAMTILIAVACCPDVRAQGAQTYSPRPMRNDGAGITKIVCDQTRDPGFRECINRCERIEDNGAKDDCWYSCNIRFGCGPH